MGAQQSQYPPPPEDTPPAAPEPTPAEQMAARGPFGVDQSELQRVQQQIAALMGGEGGMPDAAGIQVAVGETVILLTLPLHHY